MEEGIAGVVHANFAFPCSPQPRPPFPPLRRPRGEMQSKMFKSILFEEDHRLGDSV